MQYYYNTGQLIDIFHSKFYPTKPITMTSDGVYVHDVKTILNSVLLQSIKITPTIIKFLFILGA